LYLPVFPAHLPTRDRSDTRASDIFERRSDPTWRCMLKRLCWLTARAKSHTCAFEDHKMQKKILFLCLSCLLLSGSAALAQPGPGPGAVFGAAVLGGVVGGAIVSGPRPVYVAPPPAYYYPPPPRYYYPPPGYYYPPPPAYYPPPRWHYRW
jgi:hypothetical protein